MKLLLDEMHAPSVSAHLRGRGHDAVAVKDCPDLIGLPDEDLLRAATADGRAVVTENVKDFAVLHRRISAAGQRDRGHDAVAVAGRLRDRGHDAVAVKERDAVRTSRCSTDAALPLGSETAAKERADLSGLTDEDLLRAATADGRSIVTENVKDFAALHRSVLAAGHQHSGLVFTHPRRFPRSAGNHASVLADSLALFVDEHGSMLGDVQSFVWWLERAGLAEP